MSENCEFQSVDRIIHFDCMRETDDGENDKLLQMPLLSQSPS